jgi:putative MATE family efflux protein
LLIEQRESPAPALVPVQPRAKRLELSQETLTPTIVRLATPAILESLLSMMLQSVSTLLLARLQDDVVLAAVGLTAIFIWIADGLFQGAAVAATAMVARALGRDDEETARRVASQALLLGGLAAALATTVMVPLAERMVSLIGAEPEVARQGGMYLRIILASSLLSFPLSVANGVMRGAGDTQTPMSIFFIINVWNGLLGYLLIFGGGPFPTLGLAGAAIATATARGLGGFLALGALFTGRTVIRIDPRRLFHWDGEVARRLVKLALPNLGEQGIQRFGYLIFTSIVAALGTTMVAAHQIAVQVESLSFMCGIGFSLAAATLVGQSLGAGRIDLAETSMRRSLAFACGVMGTMGLVFLFFGRGLVAAFGAAPRTQALAAMALHIAAVEQIAMAINMVLAGGQRGAGDTRTPLYVALFGAVFFRVAVVYLFAIHFGWGLAGIWWGITLDWWARAALMLVLFRRGRWKGIRL